MSAEVPDQNILAAYLEDLERATTPVRLLGLIDEGKPVGSWEGSRILGNFQVLARLLAERASELRTRPEGVADWSRSGGGDWRPLEPCS